MANTFLMSRKNDYVFKRIFGDPRNKSILISFLNAILIETIVDVEILNPELKREHLEDSDHKHCGLSLFY